MVAQLKVSRGRASPPARRSPREGVARRLLRGRPRMSSLNVGYRRCRDRCGAGRARDPSRERCRAGRPSAHARLEEVPRRQRQVRAGPRPPAAPARRSDAPGRALLVRWKEHVARGARWPLSRPDLRAHDLQVAPAHAVSWRRRGSRGTGSPIARSRPAAHSAARVGSCAHRAGGRPAPVAAGARRSGQPPLVPPRWPAPPGVPPPRRRSYRSEVGRVPPRRGRAAAHAARSAARR